MKATMRVPMAVKAAATIANGNWPWSIFQVRREGDRARVTGTNGYTCLTVLVPASFNRWPDRKSVTLGRASVQAMMRGIARGLEKSADVSIHHAAGVVTASVEPEGATVSCAFDAVAPDFGGGAWWDDVDWTSLRSDGWDSMREPGTAKLLPYQLTVAARAVETVLPRQTCTMSVPDSDEPIRFEATTDELALCCLVMPGPGRKGA